MARPEPSHKADLPAHMPVVDGLRGVAILLVFWHHGVVMLRPPAAAYDGWFWRSALSAWSGVDLFFALSGFLITRILLKGRGHRRQLPIFWARRALRIFPLAGLFFAVLYLTRDRVPGLSPPGTWWPYVLYVANLEIAFKGWPAAQLAVLWSLAVEEQFYLVWPFVVRAFDRKVLLVVTLAIIAASPFARAATFDRLGYPAVYVATWCRFDALAIGGLLALLTETPATREVTLRMARLLLLPALLFLAWCYDRPFGGIHPATLPRWLCVWGYSLLSVAFTVLVANALRPMALFRIVVGNPVLRHFGRVSYGFYLWHLLVVPLLFPLLPASLSLEMRYLLWLAVTTAVATVSWFAFERPILSLKNRVVLRGA